MGLNAKTLVIADAACNLTKNRHFGESAHLETLWQDTHKRGRREEGLDITIICAHPSYVQKEAQQALHSHSFTCPTDDLIISQQGQNGTQSHVDRQSKESEADIVVDAQLSAMKEALGSKMFPIILEQIHVAYLGREIGVMQCLLQRPDLFEKAFLSFVGKAGETILGFICKKTRNYLQLNDAVSSHKK